MLMLKIVLWEGFHGRVDFISLFCKFPLVAIAVTTSITALLGDEALTMELGYAPMAVMPDGHCHLLALVNLQLLSAPLASSCSSGSSHWMVFATCVQHVRNQTYCSGSKACECFLGTQDICHQDNHLHIYGKVLAVEVVLDIEGIFKEFSRKPFWTNDCRRWLSAFMES